VLFRSETVPEVAPVEVAQNPSHPEELMKALFGDDSDSDDSDADVAPVTATEKPEVQGQQQLQELLKKKSDKKKAKEAKEAPSKKLTKSKKRPSESEPVAAKKKPKPEHEGVGEGDEEENKDDPETTADRAFIDDRETAKEWINPEGSESEGSEPRRTKKIPEAREVDEIDAAINRIDSKKPKKKPKMEAEDYNNDIKRFISKMDDVVMDDEKSNRMGKPAMAKLGMLDEVLNFAKLKGLQELLLDNGLLSSMGNWLKPLPDGSLPNVRIRTQLLQLLYSLPCGEDNLKRSQVGREVMRLVDHKDETPDNRKLCNKIIEKWARPLFKLDSNFKSFREEAAGPTKPIKK